MNDLRLFRYMTYAFGMLLAMAALEFVVFHPLKREAELLVQDTLPGLTYSAEVNSGLDENFIRVLLLSKPQFADEREIYIQQIEQFSAHVGNLLEKYRATVLDETDRASFDAFVTARVEFAGKRTHFFSLVRTNPEIASVQLKSELLPAFQKYNAAGKQLLAINKKIGEERSTHIIKLLHFTPIVTLVVALLVLLVGGILVGRLLLV